MIEPLLPLHPVVVLIPPLLLLTVADLKLLCDLVVGPSLGRVASVEDVMRLVLCVAVAAVVVVVVVLLLLLVMVLLLETVRAEVAGDGDGSVRLRLLLLLLLVVVVLAWSSTGSVVVGVLSHFWLRERETGKSRGGSGGEGGGGGGGGEAVKGGQE